MARSSFRSAVSSKWKNASRPSFNDGRPLATVATARPDGPTESASSRGTVPPLLSQQMESALAMADQIVGNSATSAHSLQHVLAEEVSVVTQILHKLVGTSHSLLEVEK